MLYKIKKISSRYFSSFFKRALPKSNSYSGLIGCGHFVKYAYVPALNNSNIPIVCSGLYSRSVQSSKEISNKLRYKTKVFTSCENLLESGIKSVIITAPNHLHYHYVVESLSRNLDVFCEKPLANSLRETLLLKSILEKTRSILMVGFNQRYLDRIKKLKLIIEAGKIGRVKEVRAFHNQNIADHLSKSDWYSDAKKSGGGVLHNAGVHLINVMLYIFGKIDRVSAEFQNIKLPVNFGEDTASCKLIFKSGVLGFFDASFVNAVSSTYEHMVIKGDNGVITTDMLHNDITIKDNSGHIESINCNAGSIPDSVYNELGHFHDCIKNRRTPDTDVDDFIETLKVTEAARTSFKEKREVSIA